MVRDYSTQKEQELQNIINEIKDENQNIIVDTILDALNWLKPLLFFFSLGDYENNMTHYHREILDRANMKSDTLRYIFQSERAKDEKYANNLRLYSQELMALTNGFNQFTDIINPVSSMELIGSNISNIAKQIKSDIEAASKASQAIIKDAKYNKINSIQEVVAKVGNETIDTVESGCRLIDSFFKGDFSTSEKNKWGLIKILVIGGPIAAMAIINAGTNAYIINHGIKMMNKQGISTNRFGNITKGLGGYLNTISDKTKGYSVDKKSKLTLNYSYTKNGDYPVKGSVGGNLLDYYHKKIFKTEQALDKSKKYFISKGSISSTESEDGQKISITKNKLEVYHSEADGVLDAGIDYVQGGYKHSNSQYDADIKWNSASLKLSGSTQVERGDFYAGANAHYYPVSASVKVKDPVYDLFSVHFTGNTGVGADASVGWKKGKLGSNLGFTSGIGFNIKQEIDFSKFPKAWKQDVGRFKIQQKKYSEQSRSYLSQFKSGGFTSDLAYNILTGNS